jgi:hypothetical protein
MFICFRLFLPYEVAALVYFDSLVTTISASINFVIFYFFNESFRKELMKIVGKPSLINSQVSYSGYLKQTQGPNVSTNSISAMGCWQCLYLSVVQLKGKHCRKPHCRNGVVDTFEQGLEGNTKSIYTVL